MAHCHSSVKIKNIPDNARKIVLAGNPNTGKSVFFNFFTGIYVDVSNYPGTTLEIYSGRFGEDVIIDTPGVYGISSFNDEESIARDVILSADIVVNIVDASHLERDLFLTQQIIDSGIPLIVALNMMDEAQKQGLNIDTQKLEQLLGVPVISTVATEKKGLDILKNNVYKATRGKISPGLDILLEKTKETAAVSQGEMLLTLEGDPIISERCQLQPSSYREEIYLNRRRRVNDIVNQVTTKHSSKNSFSDTLSRWMIKPITGIPLLAVTLYAMYLMIGVFIAGTVVGFTEETVMLGIYEPLIRELVGSFVSLQSTLGTLLAGEFGVLTMTFSYVLGLLMPLVVGFYLFLSFFEDTGYLPRIATLVDRLLNSIGLNGRAIIPLILGFGCVTMATITTRLLGSNRERIIAIVLLGLTIPCSAQIAVIAGMLSSLGGVYVALFTLVITSILIISGTILNAFLPGQSTSLLIDLPRLRLPRFGNVIKKTVTKSYNFLKEAFLLFAIGALLISTLQVTGILETLQNALVPLTVGWLKLPKETATAFIMGIVRRDFGAAGLSTLTLTPIQTVASLITITLFVPCIASIMILFKERPKIEAAMIWAGSWIVAFLVGGLVINLYSVFADSYGSKSIVFVALSFIIITLAVIAGCKGRKKWCLTEKGAVNNV